ncbi:DUF2127 domain-containing protein [Mycobacteroides abscessus]|uniref:DUF2127 domain-containing protein n=1 Tax=Mycobacteroides abscessus TaxID=36809 RepID=UPI0011A37B73|nr:DUF2127 domain-containing protein [Mycobacteroides abscessus]
MINFALRSCGLRGHATFDPDEQPLRERLRVSTPVGEAWRCLRCETFVVGTPRYRGPADTAPEVPRGRLLRDRTLMRVLAVERVVRGLVFVLLAVVVVKVRGSREHLQRVFEQDIPLIRPLANQIGWNPDNSKIIHHIGQAFSLSSTTLLWVAVGLAAYASIEFIEAIGLWLMKRWGEYFAVIATSIFLPLEIYELIEGGGKAYEREHRAESLLSVERAALGENLEAA